MHKRITSIAAIAAALLLSGSAQAATLDYTGTLEFRLGSLPPLVFTGGETGVSVSSGSGHFTIGEGAFQVTDALESSLFTGVPTIDGLSFTISNGTGTFSGAGGGIMPLKGLAKVTLLKGFATLTVPLDKAGAGGPGRMVARTPAGCAIGSCNNTTTGKLAGIFVTATAGRWTSDRARVTGVTFQTGSVFVNTVSATGYDNRDQDHVGRIQFVSPLRVMTNAAGNLASFGLLKLEFVPEPGTLILLGSASVGLAMIGFGRRRR